MLLNAKEAGRVICSLVPTTDAEGERCSEAAPRRAFREKFIEFREPDRSVVESGLGLND